MNGILAKLSDFLRFTSYLFVFLCGSEVPEIQKPVNKRRDANERIDSRGWHLVRPTSAAISEPGFYSPETRPGQELFPWSGLCIPDCLPGFFGSSVQCPEPGISIGASPA